MKELIIGSHVSFKRDTQLLGSLEEALSYGANTFMFYTGAPQNTMRTNIDLEITKLAQQKMKENNISLPKKKEIMNLLFPFWNKKLKDVKVLEWQNWYFILGVV